MSEDDNLFAWTLGETELDAKGKSGFSAEQAIYLGVGNQGRGNHEEFIRVEIFHCIIIVANKASLPSILKILSDRESITYLPVPKRWYVIPLVVVLDEKTEQEHQIKHYPPH